MIDLVSVADAREHLRLDSDNGIGPDDVWLSIWIPAVSQAIGLWLRDESRAFFEDTDGKHVHPVVRAAALVELATQYRNREDRPTDSPNYIINRSSAMLLSGLRAPQVK